MAGSLTFTVGVTSQVVEMPLYDYQVDIHMALLFVQLANGKINSWDRTANYDFRICKVKWILDETSFTNMYNFFNSGSLGRGNNVTLSLGTSASGFYPGGPDKGDVGNFIIKVINFTETGMSYVPWLRLQCTLEFVIVSYPTYSLPSITGYKEGNFYIGSIAQTLQYPTEGFAVSNKQAIINHITHNGTAYSVDKGTGADINNNSFLITANQPNAAAIINHLVTSVRGNEFTIDNSANVRPYGISKAETPTIIKAKLNENIITIKHSNHNQFLINLATTFNAVE